MAIQGETSVIVLELEAAVERRQQFWAKRARHVFAAAWQGHGRLENPWVEGYVDAPCVDPRETRDLPRVGRLVAIDGDEDRRILAQTRPRGPPSALALQGRPDQRLDTSRSERADRLLDETAGRVADERQRLECGSALRRRRE